MELCANLDGSACMTLMLIGDMVYKEYNLKNAVKATNAIHARKSQGRCDSRNAIYLRNCNISYFFLSYFSSSSVASCLKRHDCRDFETLSYYASNKKLPFG